mmetsp:Transcript_19541/g.77741  ORF Transcript_19541/g.77741 Transcript_19541/m.77741 type:complete len:238 (-) Transcript_19541:169-882(-)
MLRPRHPSRDVLGTPSRELSVVAGIGEQDVGRDARETRGATRGATLARVDRELDATPRGNRRGAPCQRGQRDRVVVESNRRDFVGVCWAAIVFFVAQHDVRAAVDESDDDAATAAEHVPGGGAAPAPGRSDAEDDALALPRELLLADAVAVDEVRLAVDVGAHDGRAVVSLEMRGGHDTQAAPAARDEADSTRRRRARRGLGLHFRVGDRVAQADALRDEGIGRDEELAGAPRHRTY